MVNIFFKSLSISVFITALFVESSIAFTLEKISSLSNVNTENDKSSGEARLVLNPINQTFPNGITSLYPLMILSSTNGYGDGLLATNTTSALFEGVYFFKIKQPHEIFLKASYQVNLFTEDGNDKSTFDFAKLAVELPDGQLINGILFDEESISGDDKKLNLSGFKSVKFNLEPGDYHLDYSISTTTKAYGASNEEATSNAVLMGEFRATPISVPEPATILGLITTLGFGALLKPKYSKKKLLQRKG